MRAYSVATVAVALNVTNKWIDNTLSHNTVPGVIKSRQGIARRLTQEAVSVLAIALFLAESLRIPMAAALEIASELVRIGGPAARYDLSGRGGLLVDVATIESQIAVRLAHASEFAPSPRRGRPPQR